MRYSLRLLVMFATLVFAPIVAFAQDAGQVQAAISQLLSSGERLALPIERIRPALTAHYVTNRGAIYWVGTGRMDKFIQRLTQAKYDGLNSADYPVAFLTSLRDELNPSDSLAAAQAELAFSSFFVAYAADLKIGRVVPQKVDPNLFRTQKTIDVQRVLTDLKKQNDPNVFLASFEPKNVHYQKLKKMLKVYTDVIDQGLSWPAVAQGPNLTPGKSDPRIASVRRILSITGDFEWNDNGSPMFDQNLAVALRKFQLRHGLEAKGVLGKQTIVALNIPPVERQRQIMLNMERWRWMPDNLGEEHFLVNIAAFELQHWQSNTIIDRMNVVVGAVATQTPEFSNAMQYIELNPYWTVPYNIATKEMLPKLQADPLAYAEDFDVFAGGKLADWASINWNAYGGTRSFPFTFRQRPGPKNALGKVKFMLPNKFNIYLHDTPAKDKFANTTRAFSHGCIRLSNPTELAYTLLQRAGMDQAAVDAIWASGENTRVNLPKPIPIHIIYATAFSSENGIEFRTDVYGRDRKLYEALFGRAGS
ncbi:MAG: L,D-transpeptidase family protein [Alphaproteobacteria bacterium]|nr:L,D-transpeptidase family protein [Alphaproteobacteria bacterium]